MVEYVDQLRHLPFIAFHEKQVVARFFMPDDIAIFKEWAKGKNYIIESVNDKKFASRIDSDLSVLQWLVFDLGEENIIACFRKQTAAYMFGICKNRLGWRLQVDRVV